MLYLSFLETLLELDMAAPTEYADGCSFDKVSGVAFDAGQMVDVTSLAAHFQSAMDEFLLELRRYRCMTAEALGTLRRPGSTGFSVSGVGRLLTVGRPQREKQRS